MFLSALEAGSPRPERPQVRCPARARLLGCGRCLRVADGVFCPRPHLADRALVSPLRISSLVQSCAPPDSHPNHLPKAPPASTIAFGVQAPTHGFRGTVWSTAHVRYPAAPWVGSRAEEPGPASGTREAQGSGCGGHSGGRDGGQSLSPETLRARDRRRERRSRR